MKKMNLPVLFWSLVGLSLTLAAVSLTGLSPQMLVLTHVACVLVISPLFWIASRKQKAEDQNQHDFKQEEIDTLHQRNRQTLNSLLTSIQDVVSSSERSTSDVENLNNLVQTTSENAKQAAMLSHQSRTTVESSVKAISELYQSMNEVSQSSKKITEILSMIEDIAFQTNLLALNAAVEAARAGEQGKGFAVVAEAVRNLAQKSSSAAKDISSLIQETTVNIKKGCDQAQSSHDLLNSILSGTLKVSDINNEISLSSQEQASSTKNLRTHLSELVMSQQDIIRQIKGHTETSHNVAISKVETYKSEPKEAKLPPRSVTAAPSQTMKEKPKANVIPLKAAQPVKTVQKPAAATPPVPALDAKPPTPSSTEDMKAKSKKVALEPSLTNKPKTSKTPQELIPFDEDEDRLKLTKASDF